MNKHFILLACYFLFVSSMLSQKIVPYQWNSVEKLPLLPETRTIHGGATGNKTILIRDVPLGMWQKIGTDLTPIKPVLPDQEILHQAWVVENYLYFISLEKEGQDDAIVHLYRSNSGPETAVKVFSKALKGGIFSLPFDNDDPYGWNFYLQTTDSLGALIFNIEYKERPFPGCGTLVQRVNAYCSLNHGEQWNVLDEYYNITTPYLYNYSNGYFISIYENSDNLLRISNGFPMAQHTVIQRKSPFNYHWNSFIIRNAALLGIVETSSSTDLVEWNLSDLSEKKKTPLPLPKASIVHSRNDEFLIHSPLHGLFKTKNISGPYQRIYPTTHGDEALVTSISSMPQDSYLIQTLDKGLVLLDAQANAINWNNLFPGTLPELIQPGKDKVILKNNQYLFTQSKSHSSAPLYAGTGFGNRGIRYAYTNTHEYAIVDSMDKMFVQKLEGQSFTKCLQYTSYNTPFMVWNTMPFQLAFTELNNTVQIRSINDNCQVKSFSTLFSAKVDYLSMNDELVVTSGTEYSFPSGQPYLHLGVWDVKTQKYLFKGFPQGKSGGYFSSSANQVFLHGNRILLGDYKLCWNTEDAGTTWNPMATLLPGRWTRFNLQDSLLLAYTDEQKFYLSADWGANWVQIDNYVPAHVNAFAFSGNQAYWFTSDSLYTTDATRLLELVNDIKVSNKTAPPLAELQPYPNPVIAGQEIKFPDLSDGPLEDVQLYDFSGKFLQTWHSPNSISIAAPGMYWLKVKTRNQLWAPAKIVVISSNE